MKLKKVNMQKKGRNFFKNKIYQNGKQYASVFRKYESIFPYSYASK